MALPSVEELCIGLPLYTPKVIEDTDLGLMRTLEHEHFQLDAFCTDCQKPSTFHARRNANRGGGSGPYSATLIAYNLAMKAERNFGVELRCSRNLDHTIVILFAVKDAKLRKIGQFPSLADLEESDFKQYRREIGESRLRELNLAIRLAAAGAGIGSYVYLRRIFESLINEHAKRLADRGKPIENFEGLRMDEKIAVLKDELPGFLVANSRALYGILSLGIHQLEEDACLAHFQILKESILLILQLDARERERMERERALAAALSASAKEVNR